MTTEDLQRYGALMDRLRNCRMAVGIEAEGAIRVLLQENYLQKQELNRVILERDQFQQKINAVVVGYKLPHKVK